MTTCPECNQQVPLTDVFMYGIGDVKVIQNHDKPGDRNVPVCPGSQTVVP